MTDIMQIPEEWNKQVKAEVRAVAELGARIGFGNMMSLASKIWGIELHRKGMMGGAEFVVGPCQALTVPCECDSPKDCDWCAASGWLTTHVKEVKDQQV